MDDVSLHYRALLAHAARIAKYIELGVRWGVCPLHIRVLAANPGRHPDAHWLPVDLRRSK